MKKYILDVTTSKDFTATSKARGILTVSLSMRDLLERQSISGRIKRK